MSNTIYIVPIEPLDNRYTKQWYINIPKILEAEESGYTIKTIDGEQLTDAPTAGAFLDFGATNVYKASQLQTIASMFSHGKIKPGDKFLITDAWNFVITGIRYMSELLKIPVQIHSIWHAGNYDPTDILGMNMNPAWAAEQERAWYYASDFNYFATDFHKDMFMRNLGVNGNKAFRSGQPHSPLIEQLSQYILKAKRDIVLFPHRLNSDKQPDIIDDMSSDLRANVIVNQRLNLTKEQYYEMLGYSKVVFSCSLHENLGISMMEGVLAGAIPIVPDRASYSEMYENCFKYPSEWTSSRANYEHYKYKLIDFINDKIENYDDYFGVVSAQRTILIKYYLTPTIMIENLTK
jgi:hypothetical protein